MSGDARFTWDYDDGRAHLLALYQKGKDKQWEATSRIDWSVDVDPANALGTPDTTVPIYGSRQWEKLGDRDRRELRQHLTAWQFSQFLHGEQGAMICSARIVESVPDLDAKFYAATQTMDEARHAETYARFLRDKVQLTYPVDPYLQALLNDTLNKEANACNEEAMGNEGNPPTGECAEHYSGPIPACVHLHGGDVPPE